MMIKASSSGVGASKPAAVQSRAGRQDSVQGLTEARWLCRLPLGGQDCLDVHRSAQDVQDSDPRLLDPIEDQITTVHPAANSGKGKSRLTP